MSLSLRESNDTDFINVLLYLFRDFPLNNKAFQIQTTPPIDMLIYDVNVKSWWDRIFDLGIESIQICQDYINIIDSRNQVC